LNHKAIQFLLTNQAGNYANHEFEFLSAPSVRIYIDQTHPFRFLNQDILPYKIYPYMY